MWKLKNLKKNVAWTVAIVGALLGLGATLALADEQAPPPPDQAAPAGEQPAPAAPTAMTTPALTGPLVANPNPASFDLGFLGPVYYNGFVSGLGMWQNNVFPGDQHVLASLSNGQFSFQKTDGLFQYYVQIGAYTIPDLGTPYFNVLTTTGDFFGPIPIAWAKLAPAGRSWRITTLPTIRLCRALTCRFASSISARPAACPMVRPIFSMVLAATPRR